MENTVPAQAPNTAPPPANTNPLGLKFDHYVDLVHAENLSVNPFLNGYISVFTQYFND